MLFTSWLHKWAPARKPPADRPAAFCPRLEVLESRDVPSALTVTNTLDTGKGSLRYEIDHAGKNSTIDFAPNLSGQTITLTSGEIAISKGITIKGPGANKLTISGGHNSRVFDVNASAPVTLTGLTISNGSAFPGNAALPFWGDGGGILNVSTLFLGDCFVSNNSAIGPATAEGAGIYNAGTLIINGGMVSGNTAIGDLAPALGGGIYNTGHLSITSCTVTGNYAPDGGGGIYNTGSLDVYSSAFSSNFAFDSFIGRYPDNIYGQYTDGGGNTFG